MPVSGTAVRANPLGCWEFLEPPVRRYYAKRVVLIGAESTGKTTLASDLATAFETLWVPEYGREYWERKMARGEPNTWRTEEFAAIAREQCRRENAAARLCNRVLVCDTDAFATRVWHHRYMGAWSPVVDAIAAEHRRPDLYLLTDVSTPFEQDGTRDGERIREWMHQTFVEQLTAHRRPFLELKGSRSQRVAIAAAAVERMCWNENPRQLGSPRWKVPRNTVWDTGSRPSSTGTLPRREVTGKTPATYVGPTPPRSM